jgi:uncharacterized protein YkwD
MTRPEPIATLSRRGLLILGSAALLSSCAATFAPAPPPPPAAPLSDRPEDLTRDRILSTINATRRANGAAPWRYNTALETAARAQATLMAQRDTLSHDLGSTLRQRVTAAGYLTAVGENVARGYGTLPGAIDGWLASQGHRNTLLSSRFVEFGLAFARTGSGRLYWAMVAGGPFEAWYG